MKQLNELAEFLGTQINKLNKIMKQEFEMTQGEMDDIISMNKNNMPVLLIGNVTTGMDLQERINNYWKGLGEKYGFKHMTVEGSSRGKLFFLAEPKAIKPVKTSEQEAIDSYLGYYDTENNWHRYSTKESISK